VALTIYRESIFEIPKLRLMELSLVSKAKSGRPLCSLEIQLHTLACSPYRSLGSLCSGRKCNDFKPFDTRTLTQMIAFSFPVILDH
jgi:hypothetical protein